MKSFGSQSDLKFNVPKFIALTSQKNLRSVVFPDVVNNGIKVNNSLEQESIRYTNYNSISLEDYVERHEGTRNLLASKKLKGQSLSFIEKKVLDILNRKLDELLQSEESEFHKENREIIDETRRLLMRLR